MKNLFAFEAALQAVRDEWEKDSDTFQIARIWVRKDGTVKHSVIRRKK